MDRSESAVVPGSSAGGAFATTHWSVVGKAGRTADREAEAALGRLCGEYWPPLYAYVRRHGHSREEAQDLTQEFFARLIGKQYVRQADRRRGRFRTFLLGALKHFLANEWDKLQTVKRGGREAFVSWDALRAEECFVQEPSHDVTAEKAYDRRWAVALLDQALRALRDECAPNGEDPLFNALQGRLVDPEPAAAWGTLAAQLGLSEGAVKMRAHRLRRRFGELLREEVGRTVSTPEELEEELRHLLSIWD